MVEKEKLVAMVVGVKNQDQDAATELYNTFRDGIYYTILATVNEPDLAEDLTQETFFEIFRTIGNLQEPAAFVTWSQRIAYHACTNYFKKRRDLIADETEDGYSELDTMEEDREEFIPDAALDKAELRQTIRDMIAQLPEEQQSALMLRYFQEMSVGEIAQIQGVSEGTVKSRLNYGRQSVKKAVEEYEKKHDIKLHCLGVVPLLIWVFRAAHLAESAATAGVGGTVVVASTGVATGTAGVTAVAAAESATAGTAVATGAKVAAGLTAKKVIAGVIAAAVLTTGAAVAVVNWPEAEPEVTQTETESLATETQPQTQPQTQPEETQDETEPQATEPQPEEPESTPVEKSWNWEGYGTVFYTVGNTRIDMVITEMDDAKISGNLQLTKDYSETFVSTFSGTVVEPEEENADPDVITYDIICDETARYVAILSYEYNQFMMSYNRKTEQFIIDDWIEVILDRVPLNPEYPVVVEEQTFEGLGEDDTIFGLDHTVSVTMVVHSLTEKTITGNLAIMRGENLRHQTEFTGRGYKTADGMYYFEILFEDPAEYSTIIGGGEITMLWIVYNESEQTISDSELFALYAFDLQKVDN